GVVFRELHVVEPLGKVWAEAPGDEVALIAADLCVVVRVGTAPVGPTDARAVPEIHGVAAPQEDALETFAAVPTALPGDGACAVPHQEIHDARTSGDLILDDAVIAAQRRARGIAEHRAADRERAHL